MYGGNNYSHLYSSNISSVLLINYVKELKKLKISHPNLNELENILEDIENCTYNCNSIEDPIFLLLTAMNENYTFNDTIKSFNKKVSPFMMKKSPKITKKGADETIDDIVNRYVYLTPKRVLKDISDDEISDISRRNSVSQISSPVMNY